MKAAGTSKSAKCKSALEPASAAGAQQLSSVLEELAACAQRSAPACGGTRWHRSAQPSGALAQGQRRCRPLMAGQIEHRVSAGLLLAQVICSSSKRCHGFAASPLADTDSLCRSSKLLTAAHAARTQPLAAARLAVGTGLAST